MKALTNKERNYIYSISRKIKELEEVKEDIGDGELIITDFDFNALVKDVKYFSNEGLDAENFILTNWDKSGEYHLELPSSVTKNDLPSPLDLTKYLL